jgi:2-aminoethylphosphonate-pyruvate transaminase
MPGEEQGSGGVAMKLPLSDETPTNGHTNGHANGHSNGHANGHTNNPHKNGHSQKIAQPPELVLLNPGPVLTSARVRQAMARVDVCHRDEAFSDVLDRLHASLKRVAQAPHHEALLLSGGGTAATEAAFSTFLSPRDKILVISNGAFGERLAEIAAVLELPLVHKRCEWGEAISLSEIEALLQDPEIRAVAMIHHETSTGRLNPVKEIGALCQGRARFFVDVISSLGAEEFSAEGFGVDVVIGSANKCLHSVPGVSFLLVRDGLWESAEAVPRRSVYLDLRRYRAAARELRQTPFTPAVHSLIALDEALRELEAEGGAEARRARYLALNSQVRQGLKALGLELRFEGQGLSAALTVAELPPALAFDHLYEAMRRRGFVIYGAKGPLKQGCFIVANMGCLDAATIDAFLAAFAEVQKSQARKVSARP